MKISYKLWLDNEGKAFGEGPVELLKRVAATESLNEAASQMGMSYSKAWRLIRTIEERLGFALLERTVGGLAGGGSRITPRAQDLVQRFELLKKEAGDAIEQIYRLHFGNLQNSSETRSKQ